MKRAELSELKDKIVDLTKRSSVGRRLEEVDIEPIQDNYGSEFLWVTVRLKGVERIDLGELAALKTSIVDAVEPLDDRFPSVSFPDAA